MIRKGLRPRFTLSIDLPGGASSGLRQALPFRRSFAAIALLAVLDAVFMIPAVLTFREASTEWSQFDSLFDLVGALFLSGWLLGWSIAPLVMTGILVLLLWGREVIKVRPGIVEISIGLPLLGFAARYDAAKMRNLRSERPTPGSGKSWRGAHLAFDYGANTVAFGSNIDSIAAASLKSRIEAAAGARIRTGNAMPADAEASWDSEAEPLLKSPVADAGYPAPVKWLSPSSLALILANLVPVAGAAFFGWHLSDVMVLYWAESAVIGFFNLCKMAVIDRWMALLAGPFFVGHFGAFMAIHFLFIYTLFVQGLNSGADGAGNLRQVAQLFAGLWPALAALFLSHAFSFFSNFLGRREYIGRSLRTQMAEPYGRIVFMQLALIFGGWLVIILGRAEVVLLIIIGVKIYFDLRAHVKQHS